MADSGTQSSRVGDTVRLQLVGASSSGASLRYAATGLSIGPSSGLISGTPTAAGRSIVTITASEAGGPSATVRFAWTIQAAVTVPHASLSGVDKHKPALSFTLVAAGGAASITTIVIRLPPGLSFAKQPQRLSSGVGVQASGGGRLSFHWTLNHSAMTFTLHSTAPTVQVTFSGAALAVTDNLARAVARHRQRALWVAVSAITSSHTTTRLALKLSV